MTYHSLTEIFDALDETRARLYERLGNITSEQSTFRPSPGTWSVAEVAEHLAIMERGLSKVFRLMLKKAEAAGIERNADEPFRPVSLEQIAERSRAEKYSAPEMVRPSGEVSIADSIERLKRSREAVHALRPRLEAIDVSGLTYPHPVFGPLDIYQWLAMIGLHEDRHLRQIERLIAAPESGASGE